MSTWDTKSGYFDATDFWYLEKLKYREGSESVEFINLTKSIILGTAKDIL